MTSKCRNALNKLARALLALTLLHSFVVPAAEKFSVDQIEIEGVSAFTRGEIESELELSLVDSLDADQVEAIGLNLKEFYRYHGYEKAGVKGSLIRVQDKTGTKKNVLKLEVNEGKPTRVHAVRLIPENLENESLFDLWKRVGPNLATQAGFVAGMVADQQKFSEARQVIESGASAEGFIGVKVTSIRFLTQAEPDPAMKQTYDQKTSRWIDVEVSVDLGEKVTFGFRGNSAITHEELRGWVEEQRLVGFGKSYVDSIKARFIDEYQGRGYSKVHIDAFPIEIENRQERHITYIIEEGEQVRFDDILFEGNEVFTDAELFSLFRKTATPQVRNGVYSPKEIDLGFEKLIESLKANGYLSARLVAVSHRIVEGKKKPEITAYISEGIQTRVKSVKTMGIEYLPKEEVLEILGLEEGEPLNLFQLSEGIERLKSRYRGAGFLDANLTNEASPEFLSYTPDGQYAEIEIHFLEGTRYKVESITIEGLDKTRVTVVDREIYLQPGDILEQESLDEISGRLRRLGIFSSIVIKVEDGSAPGIKKVRVLLDEAYPGVIGGGVGFRNDLGPRLFGELSFNNLWRSNHTVSLTGSTNRRFESYRFLEYQFQISYLWPYILSDIQLRPEVTFEKRQFDKFDAQTLDFTATLSKQLLRRTRLVALLSYSLERVRQFNADSVVDNQTLTIGSLTPGMTLDLRDNPLAPSKGFLSSVTYEFAHPALGSQEAPFQVGFTRFQWRNDYHLKLAEYMILFLSFRTGIERNRIDTTLPDGSNDNRVGIPLIKQFALGGSGSLRGWNFQELSLPRGTVLQGMASYVNYRAQFDFPVSGALTFGPFVDAANILLDDYSFGQLRYGTGFGFRYQTPVGPVNFDWGFKVQPRAGEDTNRFYFSIGVL